MTLPPTLTLHYWFAITPQPFAPLFGRILLVTFVALIVLGIVAHLVRLRGRSDKLIRRVLGRSGTTLITAGLIGFLLFAFDFEGVPILTMRVLYLVLGVWFAWSFWRIFRFATKDIPAIREREARHHAFTKWLPKRKK